jgi:bacteriophage HK97-gp10 putative tail-component
VAVGAVRVRGLRELNRDFRKISSKLSDELRDALKEAAEPVREEAEGLALGKIRNMPRSPRWAGMRIGVSRAAATVYMVPAARSRRSKGGSRPNLANLLLDQAMDPALDNKQDSVIKRVDDMLEHLFSRNGF